MIYTSKYILPILFIKNIDRKYFSWKIAFCCMCVELIKKRLSHDRAQESLFIFWAEQRKKCCAFTFIVRHVYCQAEQRWKFWCVLWSSRMKIWFSSKCCKWLYNSFYMLKRSKKNYFKHLPFLVSKVMNYQKEITLFIFLKQTFHRSKKLCPIQSWNISFISKSNSLYMERCKV